jgi:hypothetical protein
LPSHNNNQGHKILFIHFSFVIILDNCLKIIANKLLFSLPSLAGAGIDKLVSLFHNISEGSGILASQSVYFSSLQWAAFS